MSGPPATVTSSGARRTWRVVMPEPMATYLATVQVGKYDEQSLPGAVPVRVVARPGWAVPASRPRSAGSRR